MKSKELYPTATEPTLDIPAQIERRKGAIKPRELADLLSLSLNQIYALINQGKLTAYRIDGAWRLDPKSTAEWLRKLAA